VFALLPPAFDETARVRLERRVDAGQLDLLFDVDASDARLAGAPKGRLFRSAADDVYYFALNVALPPFDDVHVRRAANLVIDKAQIQRLLGNPLRSRVATHLAPDGLEGNLLLDLDPYATHGHHGDLAAAKAEMAQSRYDRDHDGICDGPACRGIHAIPLFWPPPPPDLLFAAELKRLGITLRYLELDTAQYSRVYPNPGAKTGIVSHGFDKEFPNASAFFAVSFSGDKAPGGNTSLVGISPEKLRRFGYSRRSVPSVDVKIRQCEALVGLAQTTCWAELDQLLMEKVVPWVPFFSDNSTFAVSSRVTQFTFDQFTTLPALDQIALQKIRR
jgi:ABC-type transport system substrate-binding protein